MICWQCGNALAANARFCGKCGEVAPSFSQEAVTETAVLKPRPALAAALVSPPAPTPPGMAAPSMPVGMPPGTPPGHPVGLPFGPPPGMPPVPMMPRPPIQAPMMRPPMGPPLGIGPAAITNTGGNKAAVIGLCAVLGLMLLTGGYWAWSRMRSGGVAAGPAAARIYVLPSINREALGTGFMLMLGAEFSFPAVIVSDSLQERVPFSAGWKIRLNRTGLVGLQRDCGMLYRDSGEALWFHRDGRIIENPETNPVDCNGDLLPALPLRGGDACGYANASTLKFQVQPAFLNCSAFSDGLARVYQGHKVGFINTSGTLAIQPAFQAGASFAEGRAVVIPLNSSVSGYIDRSGKMVIPARFTQAGPFQEGLASVKLATTHLWGFIDPTGTIRIPAMFDRVLSSFSNGRAFVTKSQKVVLIDTAGRTVAEWPQGTGAGEFQNGVAKLELADGMYLVDRAGKLLNANGYREMGPLFLGHATAVTGDGKTVLLSQSGKVVMGAALGQLGRFEGKYVTRSTPEYVDLVDLNGKSVLRVRDGQLIRNPKP